MSRSLDKLKEKLKEIFQLDQADLDFGIYRIMNQKRDEITKFLENDLLPQVKAGFEKYRPADKAEIQKELDDKIKQYQADGVDPETVPRVKELREKLKDSVDITALEDEVYTHLFNFFRRYYQEGDFISLRRYKEGVYAIPYEGEEVKLHWANNDQYYIKTTEYFRDYTFTLASGKRVHFKLVEADTEKDNIKASNGNDRRFIICDEDPIVEQDGELFIRFEYRPDDDKRKQKALNDKAIETVFAAQGITDWIAELSQKRPTESNPDRTLLEKHLTDYTARNTFDYFIHKDLGKFLRRELDFYIKNEIMHLDDIEDESAPRAEQYLSKIKVIRSISHKVIAFLSQIEDFQKKLWLKKKFVVETNYCITLDRVPEELYPEIIANDAQKEEWIRLFGIDKIEQDTTTPAYSSPLTLEFLKANPLLVLDTIYYSEDFKSRLLASIDNLDSIISGELVNSDNFHGLRLIQQRYAGQVRCAYIDPPFNLEQNADFLYKTDYKDSTWVAMLHDRIHLGHLLLQPHGVMYVRCDSNGNHLVRCLCDHIYGANGFQYELCVQRIRKNVTGQGRISLPLANDSLFLYYKSSQSTLVDPYLQLQQTRESYWRRIDDSAGYRHPPERIIFGKTFLPYKTDAHFKFAQSTMDKMIEEGRIRLKCRTKGCKYEHYRGDWSICPSCGEDNPVPQYLVDATDRQILDTNWMDISGYSSRTGFSTENSEVLLERALKVGSDTNDVVIDYFAGSGTTCAVAHRLGRRWIGIEMGQQFYDVIVPRLKETIKQNHTRSKTFKYVRLESYEDTLNNLDLKKSQEQQELLDAKEDFGESYKLSYMLDVESEGSNSLLNLGAFADPFNYTMNISTGSAGESKPTKIDLVETFNYLIGLTVQYIDHIQGFRVIQGTNPKGDKVLIIWRNLKEKSNADLDEFFRKQEYNPRDMEFDLIYVNGDNNLENLRRDDETWKVRLIEEDFKRLMFETEEI